VRGSFNFLNIVMAGLDPAITLSKARPCQANRDRRVKPGDDGAFGGPPSLPPADFVDHHAVVEVALAGGDTGGEDVAVNLDQRQ
jgi:hypothetical protein